MASGFFPFDDAFNPHHSAQEVDDPISLEDLRILLAFGLFSAPPEVSLDSIFQDLPQEPNPIIQDPRPETNQDSSTNMIPITHTIDTLIPVDTVSLEQIVQPTYTISLEQIAQPADTISIEEIAQPAGTVSLEEIAQPAHTFSLQQTTQPAATFLPYRQTHFPDLPNSSNFSNGFVAGGAFSAGNGLPGDFVGSYSYSGGQNMANVQGGYDYEPQFNGMPWPCFQPSYPPFVGPPAFLGSGNNFMFDQFGRPYYTGGMQGGSFPRPTFVDGETPKSRQYNTEERKKKIEKYRNKRNQRNFAKTIKYACRKAVAESIPRVRGRFACIDGGEGTSKQGPSTK